MFRVCDRLSRAASFYFVIWSSRFSVLSETFCLLSISSIGNFKLMVMCLIGPYKNITF